MMKPTLYSPPEKPSCGNMRGDGRGIAADGVNGPPFLQTDQWIAHVYKHRVDSVLHDCKICFDFPVMKSFECVGKMAPWKLALCKLFRRRRSVGGNDYSATNGMTVEQLSEVIYRALPPHLHSIVRVVKSRSEVMPDERAPACSSPQHADQLEMPAP